MADDTLTAAQEGNTILNDSIIKLFKPYIKNICHIKVIFLNTHNLKWFFD